MMRHATGPDAPQRAAAGVVLQSVMFKFSHVSQLVYRMSSQTKTARQLKMKSDLQNSLCFLLLGLDTSREHLHQTEASLPASFDSI